MEVWCFDWEVPSGLCVDRATAADGSVRDAYAEPARFKLQDLGSWSIWRGSPP